MSGTVSRGVIVLASLVWCGATVRAASGADTSAAEAIKRIDQLGVKATFASDNKTATRVYLGKSQTTDADLAWVGSLSDLIELSLANTKITDAGLMHLTGLKKLE